jgi:hypothetical protein
MQTYNIPSWGKIQLEEKVQKLNKRANKIGCPELQLKVLNEELVDEMVPAPSYAIDGQMEKSGRKIKMFEIELVGDPVRINGWEFLAALTHTVEGNLIRQTPIAIEQKLGINEKYRTASNNCDHCKMDRPRKNTYIVRNIETGEIKQVGSTCLVDFLGHCDPSVIEHHFNSLDAAEDIDYGKGQRNDFYISLHHYLEHVCTMIRVNGWVSSKVAYEEAKTSTATRAWSNMFLSQGGEKLEPITDDDKQLAEKVIAWGKTLKDRTDNSDYFHNLSVLFQLDYVDDKSLGLIASSVVVYQKEVEKVIEKAKGPKFVSEHFGEVGKRAVYSLTLLGCKVLEGGEYGPTFFYRFVDEKNHVAVWFASNDIGVEVGEVVTLKATVKKHDEYKGMKQTVLTRCTLL